MIWTYSCLCPPDDIIIEPPNNHIPYQIGYFSPPRKMKGLTLCFNLFLPFSISDQSGIFWFLLGAIKWILLRDWFQPFFESLDSWLSLLWVGPSRVECIFEWSWGKLSQILWSGWHWSKCWWIWLCLLWIWAQMHRTWTP